jgi:pantothenate kinase type III
MRRVSSRLSSPSIGNTGTAAVPAGRLSPRRAATGARASRRELELSRRLLRLDDASWPTSRDVASVVPAMTAAIETVAARRGQPLLIAGHGTVPLAVRTERPADVGADRLVNALAAHRLYGTPAVVVDFGTATTFDASRPTARMWAAHRRGSSWLEALARLAKPRIELRTLDRAIGATRSAR